MKKYLFVLITISIIALLLSFTSQKEKFNKEQIEINKDYAFCIGLYSLNYKTGVAEYSRSDGSIEVYFIDSLLVLDTEETKIFAENYFDSLYRVSAYKSGLDSDLSIAKCLDMYNSDKLDKFVKQKIRESKND